MGFLYTGPRHTQHLLNIVLIGGAIGLGASPWGRAAWTRLVEQVPEWLLVIGGAWLVHQVVFWVTVGLFAVVDKTDKPAFISRHRIQDGKPRVPPTPRVLKVLAINQLVYSPLMLALVYGLLKLRGWEAEAALPSLPRLFVELVILGVCSIIFFYASHRFLHRPWWMKKVHRVHHEFRTTTAWASEYAHPVEFIVGNFGTLTFGVLVVAPHLATLYLFTVVAMLQVLVHHAGYALPWASWAVHHDWHHYRYKEAFGTIGIMDRIFGTQPELSTLEEGDRR